MNRGEYVRLIGWAAFLVSCALTVFVARRLGRRASSQPSDALCAALAAGYLQISALCVVLSLCRSLTPAAFLVGQVLVAFVVARVARSAPVPHAEEPAPPLTRGEAALAWLAAGLIAASLVKLFVTPLLGFDAPSCYASRVLYWIQAQAVAPYATANEKQHAFAYGSSLAFLWPLLFTRCEIAGRLVQWLTYPGSAVLVYLIVRALSCTRLVGLVGAIAFLSSPMYLLFSFDLQPDPWVTFFSLNVCYWALRAAQAQGGAPTMVALGLSSVLAANVKHNALTLVAAGAAVAAWVGRRRGDAFGAPGLLRYAIGAGLGVLLSGFGLLLVYSMLLFSGPLGSRQVQRENLVEPSVYQAYVHSVRFVAVLAEVPLPVGNDAVERAVNRLVELVGAGEPLPKEREVTWIGEFRYRSPRWLELDENLGGVGLLVLVAAGAVTLAAARGRSRFATLTHDPAVVGLVPALAILLGTLFVLRWIQTGTRTFLAPGIACLLPFAVAVLGGPKGSAHLRAFTVAIAALFGGSVFAEVVNSVVRQLRAGEATFEQLVTSPVGRDPVLERCVPGNATLLALTSRTSIDYGLFGVGFTRRVVQLPGDLDLPTIEQLVRDHPGAFLYAPPGTRLDEVARLGRHPGVVRLSAPSESPVFRIVLAGGGGLNAGAR